jgi:mono/diheme cytochrome c family protein
MKKFLMGVGATVVAGLVVGLAMIYFGAVDIGADTPHPPLVFKLLETARERSIAARVGTPDIPNLEDPKRIADGAGEYGEMCQGCHLGPGVANTEMRQGLYPQPPELAKRAPGEAARDFWIIKHGIKASGMPAWGLTHDDAIIWSMVAFLHKLPQLTPAQYQAMTANASDMHEQMKAGQDMPGMEDGDHGK